MQRSEIGDLWDRLARFLSPENAAGVAVTTTQAKLGVSALREVVELLECHATPDRNEPGVACVDCGGPCDAADSVADDSGLAWCGSLYGNGCADRNGVTA